MINLWISTKRGFVRADWIVAVNGRSNGDLRLTTTSTESDAYGTGPDEFLAAEGTAKDADRNLVGMLATAQAKGLSGVIEFESTGPVLTEFE